MGGQVRILRNATGLVSLSLMLASPARAQTSHRPAFVGLEGAGPSPFADNNGLVPPKGVYGGPLFKLNAAWPRTAPPPLANPPWSAAIHGEKITIANAPAYAAALRDYVAQNAKDLIMHYDTWDAAKARWYNEPWLGSLRESIHGTYPAGEFGPGIFPDTGLRATFSTHVLTYYDERAAYSLYKLWGQTAMNPNLQTASAQFDEGSVVVKAAVFTSTDLKQPRNWWDAMKGAQEWPVYINPTTDASVPTQVWPGYVAQFDIIVKDSKSAPQTGWVFMTLVYDSSVPGDVWAKMIPLGAQWGNDAQATKPGQPLVENWTNPKAPKYSTETLGWGGRLSGPNDGARNDIAVSGKVEKNEPDSSCMSCHSTAQWNVTQHKMPSFLLPSFAQSAAPGFKLCGEDGKPNPAGPNICSPEQASAAWMKWFKDRLGTQPMDKGAVAMDFDEVFCFKSLPMWWKAVGPRPALDLTTSPQSVPLRFNQYTGAPLPPAAGK